MLYTIDQLQGVNPRLHQQFRTLGLYTTLDLVTAASFGHQQLACDLGVSDKVALNFIRQAELMRIPGVATDYIALLDAAGVESVEALSESQPALLAKRLAVANESNRMVQRLPSELSVAKWIRSAKELV